ncbi:MAG: hypothetical protein GX234_02865 [Clostridiales bacterium]|nr:hypothetical protein [Clostridiales bacterium]
MMDNFMDKLAQKLNAQEVIKANAQAEAAEMRRLQVQLEAYDKCLSEIRELNQKNGELAVQTKEIVDKTRSQAERSEELTMRAGELVAQAQKLMDEGISKIADMPDEDKEERERLLEEIRMALEENQKKLSEMFAESDEFVHKENVKVYRNVQAVIVDELKAQTEQLTAKNEENAKKAGNVKTMVIAAAALSGINMILLIVQLLVSFGII